MSNSTFEQFDISCLPIEEDDHFEFKSSSTINFKALASKIQHAASGFANSGGGIFVAGVDGKGNADGGFAELNDRQPITDWVDQIIHRVEPAPNYKIKLFSDSQSRGFIDQNNVVIAIEFEESYFGPHMAPDNKYYIRAGAHTVPARHFIVESMWAKRHFKKPRLAHVFREKPTYSSTVQLGVVALTEAPALEVEISISELGSLMNDMKAGFPLKLPVIDSNNPFFFDVATWKLMSASFGPNAALSVRYKDLAGNEYDYNAPLKTMSKAFGPMRIGADAKQRIANSLEAIDKSLKSLLNRFSDSK